MKYFMQYRAEIAQVIDQSPESRHKLLTGPLSADLEYLISLVDLLATCAEVTLVSNLTVDFESACFNADNRSDN